MNSELQLLVLWSEARRCEADILGLVYGDDDLDVIGEVEVAWPRRSFGLGLGQLYGQRLPSTSEKQRHCGNGPFLVMIVRDRAPRPGLRRTPRGIERVNTHVFDLKQRARELSGGGHRVHATQDVDEFRHDLPVLLGMEAGELAGHIPWVGRRHLAGPPVGAEGWPDVATMLRALDRAETYCVLRNFESWNISGPPADEHPDIDLLVMSVETAACSLAASRTSRRAGRVQYETSIAGRRMFLDLRTPLDGYLPVSLAEGALRRRRRAEGGYWVPGARDHFDTLAYHALIHRPEVADDYRNRLTLLASELGIGMPDLDREDGPRELLDLVLDGGEVVLPRDPSVGFNESLAGPVAGLARRRARQQVRSLGARGLRRLGVPA